MARHPIQPLEMDDSGTLRFKRNAIVEHLIDKGSIDMNRIAQWDFSQEDREQFAQLLGYSYSGAADLSYFSDETLSAAMAVYETGKSETDARLDDALDHLNRLREVLREPMAELFSVHPDDLKGRQP